MPELPPAKRQPHPHPVPSAGNGRYVELHCRTNFSFLEGASHPDELVQRAAELGYAALAITDRNSVAGVVRAHVAAKEIGLKLLIGAEVMPSDAPAVLLLATDRAAYGRLVRLLTVGKRRAPKGECQLILDDVAQHAEGLLACAAADLPQYREIFGDRLYALAELFRGPDDARRLQEMRTVARRAHVPLVAANDVHYHVPERQFLQDVLTAIRLGRPVSRLGDALFPNAERHLKSPQQMAEAFAECPEAVARTLEVASRCAFSLDELRYEYPAEVCPAGLTPMEHLTRLTWEGARERYPQGLPDKVRSLIEHELRLIEDLRYEAYFLTVWDLVRFARSRDILCQGRGSAANSVVCYCLGVTSVDPDRIDVLFERFISRERNEAPDIDVDFEHERREEVIQYVYEKFGRERAGMTAEVITYRPRSAIRDVGKALGLSLDRVDTLAKTLEHFHETDKLAARFREAGMDPLSRLSRQLIHLVREIQGFPRHLSQHVGGLVITQGPLCELVPIENAAMPDRTVIEWDKDDLDALGILKVDCLALGMLTAIRKAFGLIEKHEGRSLTLANVPREDPAVYTMICRADTIGVFQIESRAQMAMLPRLRPQEYYDLVIEVAIVRPGPIQGDMVHPYLRRRAGEEAIEYPDERVKSVLSKTLGVPIFQEQAMRLVVVAAGFTPGEADQLRRAMGAWRRPGIIDQFHKKLSDGLQANGYTAEYAERIFHQLRGFGEYGFPESHAASFALLVYISAWIKKHYPAAFAAALINSQPMGFYAPAQIVADARRHGVEVLPADVNPSDWDCTLEPGGLRLGLRMLRGLSEAHARLVVERRGERKYESIDEFAQRTGLGAPVIARLARADAFRSLEPNRRTALWQALPERLETFQVDDPRIPFPPLAPWEEVSADYRNTGLSLRNHPLTFLRAFLEKRRVTTAAGLAALAHGKWVRVGGLVLMRQRPATANGITFVTLEDETGVANLIVHPQVWERFHKVARRSQAMIAQGIVQRRDDVIHIFVDRLEDLSQALRSTDVRSRDFR